MQKEEKIKKRKLKWQIKLILILILLIIYCFCIGPKGIFIKEYKIETNKISRKLNGLKILQFSDLHYGSYINEKKLKKIIEKINLTKPDIVIFTGDLIDEEYQLKNNEDKKIINYLNKINTTFGKYYITGEEDKKNTKKILNLSNFVNINDNEQLIYLDNNTPILLVGTETAERYFINNTDNNFFKILAIHNPDEIKDLTNYSFDMALAGHTHGGQVNIPKIRELLIDSKYKRDYQKIKNTKLFVNPGIGTSNINIRIFNHPQIYLFRINKTSN